LPLCDIMWVDAPTRGVVVSIPDGIIASLRP